MADIRRKLLYEDVLRVRVKGNPGINKMPNTAGTPSDLVNIVDEIDKNNSLVGNLSDLQEFRELSSDAEARYRIFDEMEKDSVISSALDMYADDATQYNRDGNVIWAESDDPDISAFANRLIDIFQLNTNAWSHIRSLVKYGDLYLELFRDDEGSDDANPYGLDDAGTSTTMQVYRPKKGSELEEYIERVENPSTVYELTRKGKTVGFVKTKENNTNSLDPKYFYQTIQVSDEDILMPSDKYVHMYLAGNERFGQTVDIEVSNDSGDTKLIKYKVNRGKSILNDVYKSYQELKLMEDALLLNRVTRSSIIRILQIEMGDMPKSQAREVLKRFKTIIEQKNFMDKTEGTFTSQANPGPIDNCIYVPTYNGKGAISASNLGGDVDIKSIVDLDYFKEKLAGGLKIPLSYISGTAQENGLGGGTSLTKIDARYARTIKRIQNVYIQGITTLINIFAVNKHLDKNVNNFTIKMVSPSTSEDAERSEDLATHIDLANSIIDLINNGMNEVDEGAMKEIVEYLINSYLNEPDISKILEDIPEENPEDMEENGEDEDFGGFGGGGHSSHSFGGDDFGGDFGSDFDSGTSDTDTGGGNDFATGTVDDTGGGDFDFGNDSFGDFESDYDETT